MLACRDQVTAQPSFASCGGRSQPNSIPMITSESASSTDGPSPQELKLALKAFKKRLKVTRLDADSKLGGGPFSSGSKGSITAIAPPNQYPRSIWDELVRQGKLKSAGHGLYSLAEP
jgi:hypothetical protein